MGSGSRISRDPENKKAGAERRLSCYTTNGAYFFFLAPPFFVAFFFFAAICSLHGEGVERRSNPPVDWSAAAGCEHPTGSARRQNFIGAKLRQTDFLKQQSGGATFRRTITTCTTKPAMEPGFALDNHLRTLKGVKQTSRSCKGGASNLPTTRCVSASEALS